MTFKVLRLDRGVKIQILDREGVRSRFGDRLVAKIHPNANVRPASVKVMVNGHKYTADLYAMTGPTRDLALIAVNATGERAPGRRVSYYFILTKTPKRHWLLPTNARVVRRSGAPDHRRYTNELFGVKLSKLLKMLGY